MFMRIDHVEIVTDQPERTVEFYTGVLGFKVRSRDRIDGSPLGVPMGLVYLDLGGTTVELISYEGASVEPAPRTEHLGYRMMALEVDDMQTTVEYLKTKGVEIVWGPKVREKYAVAAVAAAPWAGRRPSLGGYVTGTGATRGVPAAGGR